MYGFIWFAEMNERALPINVTFTQTRKDLRALQLKIIKTHLALFDNYLSKQMQ